MLQLAMTTYQAYNEWNIGGDYSNLYGGGGAWINPLTDGANPALPVQPANGGTGGFDRAYGVSFDRPFGEGFGASFFFMYEYSMIRWLERNHYDVKYCSNVDVDDPHYVINTHTQV